MPAAPPPVPATPASAVPACQSWKSRPSPLVRRQSWGRRCTTSGLRGSMAGQLRRRWAPSSPDQGHGSRGRSTPSPSDSYGPGGARMFRRHPPAALVSRPRTSARSMARLHAAAWALPPALRSSRAQCGAHRHRASEGSILADESLAPAPRAGPGSAGRNPGKYKGGLAQPGSSRRSLKFRWRRGMPSPPPASSSRGRTSC